MRHPDLVPSAPPTGSSRAHKLSPIGSRRARDLSPTGSSSRAQAEIRGRSDQFLPQASHLAQCSLASLLMTAFLSTKKIVLFVCYWAVVLRCEAFFQDVRSRTSFLSLASLTSGLSYPLYHPLCESVCASYSWSHSFSRLSTIASLFSHFQRSLRFTNKPT